MDYNMVLNKAESTTHLLVAESKIKLAQIFN